MKKNVITLSTALLCCLLQAQTGENFIARYNLLTSRLGYCGIGVETLLDRWESSDSSDVNMMLGRFNYCYTKSMKDSVISLTADRYLGQKPVMSLKDSLGVVHNYFSDRVFDDRLLGEAVRWMNKALLLSPDRLDLFETKALAIAVYEKGSPDLCMEYVTGVIKTSCPGKIVWRTAQGDADAGDFPSVIQKLCYHFFKCATPGCYEAFRSLSATMLKFYPDNVDFIDNLGSYWLVAKNNPKTALKYYAKALKIKPDDATAQTNSAIAQRQIIKAKAGGKK